MEEGAAEGAAEVTVVVKEVGGLANVAEGAGILQVAVVGVVLLQLQANGEVDVEPGAEADVAEEGAVLPKLELEKEG